MKFWWFGASLAFAAALAACSGNIGGGSSTLPGSGASPISQVAQPTATPTPLVANNIVTYGDPKIAGPQPLPTIQGYGGTITFAAPAATPKGGQSPVAIGITAGIVAPTDAPVFDPAAETRKKNFLAGLKRTDKSAPVPLFYISLVATSDVTLHEYPQLAIDVPRDIVLKYREGSFGLALFDPAKKTKRYDLAVAERDSSSPAPATAASRAPSPVPSASPTAPPTLQPGQSPTPLPSPKPSATPTLPPQRIAFTGTAVDLELVANRPVVFALYAIPVPKPSPSPSPKPRPSGSPSASPVASASPTVSPAPAASGSAGVSPAPSGT
ncbi:MAG: hypothetical protein WCE44_12300 [Candidatus Velthaea sp.]|jgi:hypothetical protein